MARGLGPENEATWDSKLAWKTLWITTFCLTLAFIAWFLPSAIIPKLASVGYTFTKGQLYWMAAMPGLAAGLLRILWMVMPPILGTRKLVTLTTLLLIPPPSGGVCASWSRPLPTGSSWSWPSSPASAVARSRA